MANQSMMGRTVRAGNGEEAVKVITPEDYLAEVTRVMCAQYPATGAALSEVRLVFGSGVRRRGLDPLHRVWGGGEAEEPLAHVLAPGVGHGKEWRHAARQVGLLSVRSLTPMS